MATKKLATLSKVKKEFPFIYKELKETFKNANKSPKLYELDYFVYDDQSNQFFLSMSSGHAESLATFDMKGEAFEDEVSIEVAEFTDNTGNSEDLYDTNDLMREGYDDVIDNS
jgi:hypothetical protein